MQAPQLAGSGDMLCSARDVQKSPEVFCAGVVGVCFLRRRDFT